MPPLVLASTSPFRRELLKKLGLPFHCGDPAIDETLLPGESPAALVARLAEAKARAVSEHHPGALVIGSDQVACIGNAVVGKPGSHQAAHRQRRKASGHEVVFYTGLCLLNVATDRTQVAVEPFVVHFRELDDAQIDRYLSRESPYHCAGSFKSEGYGITLFRRLEGRDPNALIGLPLIALIEMLGNEGIVLP